MCYCFSGYFTIIIITNFVLDIKYNSAVLMIDILYITLSSFVFILYKICEILSLLCFTRLYDIISKLFWECLIIENYGLSDAAFVSMKHS